MSIKLNIDSQFISKDKNPSMDVKMEVSGRTVGDCLQKFLATKPEIKRDFFAESGELEKSTYIMVNQVPVFGDKLSRAIKEGDEITFLYASQDP